MQTNAESLASEQSDRNHLTSTEQLRADPLDVCMCGHFRKEHAWIRFTPPAGVSDNG